MTSIGWDRFRLFIGQSIIALFLFPWPTLILIINFFLSYHRVKVHQHIDLHQSFADIDKCYPFKYKIIKLQ